MDCHPRYIMLPSSKQTIDPAKKGAKKDELPLKHGDFQGQTVNFQGISPSYPHR